MERIATIDIGTNTALLLVADVRDGNLEIVHEDERFVRLGEGVDANGHIGEAAIGRLMEAMTIYRGTAEAWGAERVLAAATSAARDATNREEVAEAVRKRTGIALRVISGEQEAALSFRGAVSAFGDLSGRCAVLDIGGGSTELIVGDVDSGELSYVRSIDLGAVRLTERCFAGQPPDEDDVEAAKTLIVEALESAGVPRSPDLPLVGAAGTPTALAMVHYDLSYDEVRCSLPTLRLADVQTWRDRLVRLTYEEVLALHDEAMPGRADVFPAGILLLDAFAARLGAGEVRVSPRGLRHGLAVVGEVVSNAT